MDWDFRRYQRGGAATPRQKGPEAGGVYRSVKGGSVCFQVLGVRREAGAKVKEACPEGWHLRWVRTSGDWR